MTTSMISMVEGQKVDQQDPCQAKSKVVADATYCDRYWECLTGSKSSMTVQTVWSGWERTGVSLTGVITHGEILTFVGGRT